jgi:hypothetical protein
MRIAFNSGGSGPQKRSRGLYLALRFVGGWVLPALALAFPASTAAQDSLEYAVKAAYLAKIAPFIEWPADAFASGTAPLNICVVGSDPFGAVLDRAAAGQQDNGHAIQVRRVAAPEPGCQIVYLQGNAEQEPSFAAALKGKPIVTVTDGAPRTRAGIINFVIVENHVRFEIDDSAAIAAGLRISSKLLQLATNVRGGP